MLEQNDDILRIEPTLSSSPASDEIPKFTVYCLLPDVPSKDLTVFAQLWADPLKGMKSHLPRHVLGFPPYQAQENKCKSHLCNPLRPT